MTIHAINHALNIAMSLLTAGFALAFLALLLGRALWLLIAPLFGEGPEF